MSKLDEKLLSYGNLMFMRQSGIWPILCQLMAILAKFLDTDFKFVLPSIYNNFDIQTNFEVNQTQIGHYIPKNTPKIAKMAISQNPILPKCDRTLDSLENKLDTRAQLDHIINQQ